MTKLSNDASEVSFLGTGDCGPIHSARDGYPLERFTELVRPVLASVDLRLGQCERQYSTRGTSMYGDAPHGRQPPEMAQIFAHCKFDVVTVASNHMYDYGPDALIDTRELFESMGMQVTGAGRDLEHARKPAIVERNGVRIGIIAYCAILPPGGEAGVNKVGVSPLRVKTTYETRGPHAPVRVLTEPDDKDLKMIVDDIAALRKQVDIVIPVFHWGVIWVPRIISDYQVTVAHACIDAGADLVLGHHAHIPKAIEVYKGKAIFYSLSNLCMTKGFPKGPWLEEPWKHGALRNHTDQDPDYPLLPYGENAKRTLLAKAILTKEGVKEVSFLPMMIDNRYRPEVLKKGDPRFDDMVNYMDWASDGFDHKFSVTGDEVRISA